MYNLSIIIPHYESVSSLKTLLESIPDKVEIEVIVVDDHSVKQKSILEDLKKEFGRPNFTFTKNINDKGAGGCRNTGLSIAKGSWILFADADDFFKDNFYHIISKYFSTDNDIVFFTPTSQDTVTGVLTERHEEYEKLVLQYLKKPTAEHEVDLRYKYLVPWSKLYKRTFILAHNIQFDEVITSNDVMFSTLAGYWMKSFDVSEETIYCVTKSAGSLITKVSTHSYFSRLHVFIRYYKFLKEHLSKEEFNHLDLSGLTSLITAVKYRLPLKSILKALYLLVSNEISIVKPKYINPFFISSRIRFYFKEYLREKDYHTK